MKDKRNAILQVLRGCSGKLENLRSIGAPNYLQEAKEQQDIVEVNGTDLNRCAARMKHNYQIRNFPLVLPEF